MWNKRREGFQAHLHRQCIVDEIDARQRKLAGETRLRQPRKPWRILRTEPVLAFIGRLIRASKRAPRAWLTHLCPNRWQRVSQIVAFIRPIENLPIAQLAAPAELKPTPPPRLPTETRSSLIAAR